MLAVWPGYARQAAAQDWSPFVLVAGLLLIGLTADGDGLFAFAGRQLGRVARNGTVLFAGAVVIIAVVTATLNLDTSVAFLTPVLVYTAASQRPAGSAGAPGPAAVVAGSALLYGCLLLSNAGSLLLPGSNLTNLIVLGHLHLTGGQFVARMWLPWLAAVVSTAAVVAIGERRSLRTMPSAAVRTAAVRTAARPWPSASRRRRCSRGAGAGRGGRAAAGAGGRAGGGAAGHGAGRDAAVARAGGGGHRRGGGRASGWPSAG